MPARVGEAQNSNRRKKGQDDTIAITFHYLPHTREEGEQYMRALGVAGPRGNSSENMRGTTGQQQGCGGHQEWLFPSEC